MENEIISYLEMCQREGVNLQAGMNYQLGRGYSVILMSLRANAPYQDEIRDDGTTLIYEGHDKPRRDPTVNPKNVDQPQYTSTGKLTQNGKFHRAAQRFKKGDRPAELVRVYEKIRSGIWSYNGLFDLVDSWIENDGRRNVFRFELQAREESTDFQSQSHMADDGTPRRRIIPSSVKLEVWKRDRGQCAICGAQNELHFDHVIPYSKGGTSLRAENVQLLCARHNISKGARIE